MLSRQYIRVLIAGWIQTLTLDHHVFAQDRLSLPRPAKTWQEIRMNGLPRQETDFTCGAAALSTLCQEFLGESAITEKAVVRAILDGLPKDKVEEIEAVGITLEALANVARNKFGLVAIAKEVTVTDIQKIGLPVLVFITPGTNKHYVLIREIRSGCVFTADPQFGDVCIPIGKFQSMWDGHCFYIWKPGMQLETAHKLLTLEPSLRLSSRLALQQALRSSALLRLGLR